MKDNFPAALKAVLKHEGGYVNNPHDPGGATNKGITQETYNGYRLDEGLAKRDVRLINFLEISMIYRKRYWDKIRGDDLPSGVDYCVFDFAVNSGVLRVSKFLQRVVGAAADGQIGPGTIAAVQQTTPYVIIDKLCDMRLGFLKKLAIFKFFGRGWTTRVEEVRETAKGMLG